MKAALFTQQRQGFMFVEAVIGLALLATLSVILAAAGGRQARVSQQNAAQYETERLAQQSLLAAQLGQPVAVANETDSVDVETLPDDGGAVRWLAVTAHHAGRSARLIGPQLNGRAP